MQFSDNRGTRDKQRTLTVRRGERGFVVDWISVYVTRVFGHSAAKQRAAGAKRLSCFDLGGEGVLGVL